MDATLEKLQVIIEAVTKPFRDEMEKVKSKTDTVAKHVDRQTARIRNSFRKIAGVVAGALSITAIAAFGKSCIELGSNLAEVQNVVDVTFGAMSESVDAFAKNAAAQFGLSEMMAKKYMGSYGAMAKAFGYSTEQAYQMSAAITGLTGDVASFYNLTQDEAYTKLTSIFTGETESLKDLGVVMTQAALDQYALANGFGRTTAKMTEQEKVMLRYQFVMSQLSAAQGDFERTSGGWANQVRVLQLRFESLKATIGQGLINALTPLIQKLNVLLDRLRKAAEYFRQFTVLLFGDAGDGSTAGGMDSAADSSGNISDNLGNAVTAAKELNKQLGKFDELNVITTQKKNQPQDGGDITGMLPDASAGEGNGMLGQMSDALDKLAAALDRLKETAEPTLDAIKKLWEEGFQRLAGFTWGTIKDFWNNFLKPMGVWMLSDASGLPRFFRITNDLLNTIDWARLKGSLAEFYTALQTLGKFAWNGLMDFYEFFLKPVAVWTMGVGIPQLVDALTLFINTVHWDKINAALANFWKALAPFATAVGQGLINFFRDLLAVGADFINAVVPGGIQALADALNSISPEKAEKIGYALGVILTAVLGFKAVSGVVAMLKKIAGLPIISGIIKLGSNLIGVFEIVNNGFGTVGQAFAMVFPKMATFGSAIFGAIKNVGAFFSLLAEGNPLLGTLAAAFPGLANALSAVGAAISGIATALGISVGALAGIVAAVIAAVAAIVYALTHWNEIKEFFTKTVPEWWNNKVIPFFLELPEKIAYAIGFAAGKLVQWAQNLVATAVEEVPKIIDAIVSWFLDLPKNIWNAIIKVKDDFVKWVNGLIATTIYEVPKIIENIVTFFRELPKKLWEAGKNAIAGFVDGVKSKWDSLRNWVDKIGDSVSKGFNDALGIHSPSTVLRKTGEYVMEGLRLGMHGKESQLISFVKNFANKVVDTITGIFDIHSPSRVTAQIAEYFVDGFNFRLRDKTPESEAYAGKWASRISDVQIAVPKIQTMSSTSGESATTSVGESDEEMKELLREQNGLLRAILMKTGISKGDIFSAWKDEAASYKKRTGRDVVLA